MTLDKIDNVFEIQYSEQGFAFQRKYPNEVLLAFIGSHYFSFSFDKRKEIKILELGCGSGANLWMIAKEGFDTYGIDNAPTSISLCNEMLKSWGCSAAVKLGDMTNLPYPDNYFDVIFDVVSMQHLTMKQHEAAYTEVFRCLKNEGRFFSYHLGENSVSLKSTDQMIDHCTVTNIAKGYPLANNGQTCFISGNEVRHFLIKAGFKNINVEKNTRSYNNQKNYLEYLSVVAEK